MRKPAFCICENKDADQLRSKCAADQRLCFRYLDSTTPLLPKSEISSLYPSSVAVQHGLRRKPRRPVFSQRSSNNAIHVPGTVGAFGEVIHRPFWHIFPLPQLVPSGGMTE